jgi:hypothetical protein
VLLCATQNKASSLIKTVQICNVYKTYCMLILFIFNIGTSAVKHSPPFKKLALCNSARVDPANTGQGKYSGQDMHARRPTTNFCMYLHPCSLAWRQLLSCRYKLILFSIGPCIEHVIKIGLSYVQLERLFSSCGSEGTQLLVFRTRAIRKCNQKPPTSPF